jgi:regulator of cell morphogenesis and NO signaling
MIQNPSTQTIGDIVADDYRTAAVLERYGLDFCCGGKRTLDEACRERGVETARVAADLDALDDVSYIGLRAADWPLDALIDHIVTRHHRYVREAIPVLIAHSTKLERVHGERHPELAQVARLFEEIADDMTLHMAKEEEILFPYIRGLVEADRAGEPVGPSPFGTVQNPIRMMEREHEAAGDTMGRIRELTGGYQPPETACTTYRVCFQELQQFERDLHRHVHLENHVLFPGAQRLEERLAVRGRITPLARS